MSGEKRGWSQQALMDLALHVNKTAADCGGGGDEREPDRETGTLPPSLLLPPRTLEGNTF